MAMWFRNLHIYTFDSNFEINEQDLHNALKDKAFKPCQAQQLGTIGWVTPLGKDSEHYVLSGQSALLVRAKKEDKVLPASAVREALDERVAKIENSEHRKVGSKEKTTLKDEIILDMLPRAFARSRTLSAYIDVKNHWLIVDSASANQAEHLITLLRECLGSLPVKPLAVNNAPYAIMSDWVSNARAVNGLELCDFCELKGVNQTEGTVRINGQDLDCDEVRNHMEAGRIATKLRLHFNDRLSFVLDDQLVIKQFKYLDQVQDELDANHTDTVAEEIDAKFAMLVGEVRELLPQLTEAFGGAYSDD